MVKTKVKFPKPTLGSVAVALAVASAALFLVGIWSGDDRWARTAVITSIPGAISGFAWIIKLTWDAGI